MSQARVAKLHKSKPCRSAVRGNSSTGTAKAQPRVMKSTRRPSARIAAKPSTACTRSKFSSASAARANVQVSKTAMENRPSWASGLAKRGLRRVRAIAESGVPAKVCAMADMLEPPGLRRANGRMNVL